VEFKNRFTQRERARAEDLSVSTTALYNKLCGVELGVSQALLRETFRFLPS
jgi:hypothetical protein